MNKTSYDWHIGFQYHSKGMFIHTRFRGTQESALVMAKTLMQRGHKIGMVAAIDVARKMREEDLMGICDRLWEEIGAV